MWNCMYDAQTKAWFKKYIQPLLSVPFFSNSQKLIFLFLSSQKLIFHNNLILKIQNILILETNENIVPHIRMGNVNTRF